MNSESFEPEISSMVVQNTTQLHGDSEQKNQLTELPTDVKRRLFSFLAPTDAAQFLVVCKSLQQAVLDDAVWELFAKSRWSVPHKRVFMKGSWKSLYVGSNGWSTCSLKPPECVDAFHHGRNLRWKLEADESESRGVLNCVYSACYGKKVLWELGIPLITNKQHANLNTYCQYMQHLLHAQLVSYIHRHCCRRRTEDVSRSSVRPLCLLPCRLVPVRQSIICNSTSCLQVPF